MPAPTDRDWQELGELKNEARRLRRVYDRAKVSEHNAMHRRIEKAEQYRAAQDKALAREAELNRWVR